MKIIDITQEILSCRVYEGDPTPCGKRIMNMKNGDTYNLSTISMCAHNGTHVDAPLHFFEDGASVDEIPLEVFVGECFVAKAHGDISEQKALQILTMAKDAGAEKRILIKGDATVTESAAAAFAEAKIVLLGVESQSVGPEEAPMAVHNILLSKNIVLLEGIVLAEAREGRYLLNCAPMKIRGFEGAPVRAILIEE